MEEPFTTSSFPRKYSKFGNAKTCRDFCARLLRGAERLIRQVGVHNPYLFLITHDEIRIAQFMEPRTKEEQEGIRQGVVNALASIQFEAVGYVAEAWTKRMDGSGRLESARDKSLSTDFESLESVVVWAQRDSVTWIGSFDITRGIDGDVIECSEHVFEQADSDSRIEDLTDIWAGD